MTLGNPDGIIVGDLMGVTNQSQALKALAALRAEASKRYQKY
jgi:hypothetical protein